MEMFCPDCMSPLVSSDGQSAECTVHGGKYKILFNRFPIPAMPERAVPGRGLGVSTSAVGLSATAQPASFGNVGRNCYKHPEIAGVALCQNCRAAVCATCVFVYPGGIHLCPNCAANPNPKISGKRKGLMWWSIGLAVVSLIGMVGMVAVARQRTQNAQAIAAAGAYMSLVPSVIGLALGIATFDRRLKTPGVAWVGVIGNGVIAGIWLLLVIIGLMK